MEDDVRQQIRVLADAVKKLASVVCNEARDPADADVATAAYMAADDIVEGRFGA